MLMEPDEHFIEHHNEVVTSDSYPTGLQHGSHARGAVQHCITMHSSRRRTREEHKNKLGSSQRCEVHYHNKGGQHGIHQGLCYTSVLLWGAAAAPGAAIPVGLLAPLPFGP